MDKTIRKYTSFDAMKADEYRYWQRRPPHERLDAVEEYLFVKTDSQNAKAIYAALASFGAALAGMRPEGYRPQQLLPFWVRAERIRYSPRDSGRRF